MQRVRTRLEQCVGALEAGTLTAADLREVIESLNGDGGGRQDLLYLQAGSTSVTSRHTARRSSVAAFV